MEMQAWIMTKLIRKKDIKEELWWVIPSRNMLRRVSLLHITVENFQIYTYFSFNEWERSIIWYKIKYLKKSRKKAEIEYILGDIVFGELGSCQLWQWHCIVVSRIHHGSQCHLNINDGFWILGWQYQITQQHKTCGAWTIWVWRLPLPPTSPTSSETMILMDPLLPPPRHGKSHEP